MAVPELSVVILCYRAEDFAPVFVAQMKRILEQKSIDYELVLVANYHRGAADRTPAIVRELARDDPRLTVVAREKEGMMGWDMRSGFAAARGRAVAVIDGDGQMRPEDIIAVYDVLRSGAYDLAKTYRKERRDGFRRLLISRVYNAVLKTLFPRVRVRDANGKPKIITRDALQRMHLTSDDWFIDAEIILEASRLGLRIGEVPTVFLTNPRRPSFIKVDAILEFARNLLVYRLKTLWR
ncbi:MAG: glycosyltransferase family 2 protein [Candidatus Rokubacteria bacterium]|nr:glycosyltransferase family 2 protein [Candidatus Rokubacteria bacterium]